MRTITVSIRAIAALLAAGFGLAGGPAPAQVFAGAQSGPAGSAAAAPGRPAAEFAASLSVTPGYEGCCLLGGRAGFAVSRRWSIEGWVNIEREASEFSRFTGGYYGVQARWDFGNANRLAGFRPFLTIGAVAWYGHIDVPAQNIVTPTGEVLPVSAYSGTTYEPPLPGVGAGFVKPLGSRIALRAEVTWHLGGDGMILQPAVSISVPVGRY